MNERTAVARSALLALGLYVVAFAVLSLGGSHRSAPVVGVAVALMVVAAVVLQLTLSRARAGAVLSPRERLLIPVLILAAGAALIAYWFFGTPTGGWGLCGLCASYLGMGQVLAEVRSRRGGAPCRGVILSGICAVLFAGGIAVCLLWSVWGLAASGIALLAAPIGLTLLSEDVPRLRLPSLRVRLLLGVGLLAGGTLWLLLWPGIPPSAKWAVIAVVVVLVGAIASSSQADVLLIVTVIALVWAAIPGGVALDGSLAPRTGQPALVSLGDSYMSGEGAKTFYEGTNDPGSNECRRSPTAYARLVVRPGGAGELHHLAFFACSGAVAADLHLAPQWPGEPIDDTPGSGLDQLDQLRALLDRSHVDVRLVILSLGGNDAGFSTIVATCLAPGSCVERGRLWLDDLREDVAGKVSAAYREVRAVVGTEVPVLIVPYPQPIRDRTCSYSLLTQAEHQFVNRFVGQLDGTLRQAARDAGFYYLDAMEGAFGDRLRICDRPPSEIGVNFVALKTVQGVVDQVVNPANWIHNSVHPNERGHEAMAAVLEAWMRAHPDPSPTPGPADRPAPFIPSTLEDLMRPDPPSSCGAAVTEPAYCDRGDVAWAITQVGRFARAAALPVLLLVAGAWLLWLPLLAWSGPRFARLGDRLAKRLWRLLT